MANINVKKLGSDKNGNYQDIEIKRLIIDLESESVIIEGNKVFKDSAGEIIIVKEKIRKQLPDAAYGALLTAAKLTKLTEWVDKRVNPPEEPEA